MRESVTQEMTILLLSKKRAYTYSDIQHLFMGLVWLIRSGSLLFLVSGSNMLLAAATKLNKPRMRNGMFL